MTTAGTHPQDTEYAGQPAGPSVQVHHAAAVIVLVALGVLVAINKGLAPFIPG